MRRDIHWRLALQSHRCNYPIRTYRPRARGTRSGCRGAVDNRRSASAACESHAKEREQSQGSWIGPLILAPARSTSKAQPLDCSAGCRQPARTQRSGVARARLLDASCFFFVPHTCSSDFDQLTAHSAQVV